MRKWYVSEAEIEALTRAMRDCELPKAQWTHAGHFAAALCFIRDGEEREMPERIRRYNVSVGGENTDTAGYHETITIASLRAAADWAKRMTDAPLDETLNALMASELGHPDWPLDYWTRETLFSTKARCAWVEPDIKALPYEKLSWEKDQT